MQEMICIMHTSILKYIQQISAEYEEKMVIMLFWDDFEQQNVKTDEIKQCKIMMKIL